jgi:hypothetical protein
VAVVAERAERSEFLGAVSGQKRRAVLGETTAAKGLGFAASQALRFGLLSERSVVVSRFCRRERSRAIGVKKAHGEATRGTSPRSGRNAEGLPPEAFRVLRGVKVVGLVRLEKTATSSS